MATDTVEQTRELIEENIDRAKDYLGDSYKKSREQAEELLGDAKKQWRGARAKISSYRDDISGEVGKYVRRNSAISLAIAAGIGLLVGLLYSRRR